MAIYPLVCFELLPASQPLVGCDNIAESQQMSPARIVIIEDNSADIALFRHALDQQREEYELEVLHTGEEALRFVQEHRTRVRKPEPCVFLVDLYLPPHDCLAVVHAIRRAPALAHIHIVVWTSLASPEQEIEIANMGALYRRKPTELREFIELGGEIIAICKGSSIAAV